MLLYLITIIILCGILWWFYPIRTRKVSYELERHVAVVLTHAAEMDEEDEELYHPNMQRSRFQGKMVAIAKAEFGYLQRMAANKAMVRKFMRDYMRRHGMRPTHIAQHLDMCVSIFFIPSDQDILSHQVGATQEAHDRSSLLHTLWESYYGKLGRMLGFTEG